MRIYQVLKIIEADKNYLEDWDELVESSINGTLFHRRDFLSYHGARFASKEKWILFLHKNNPLAQIVFTIDEEENEIIARSPYGGTYGGFVFQKYPSYSQGNVIAQLLIDYLRQNKVTKFLMTPPISCCSEKPLDTFYFNLLEVGFKYINFDVSSVIVVRKDVSVESTVSQRAKRTANKASKLGIVIENKGDLIDFWQVLEKNFTKTEINPTHTFDEFKTLMSLLPNRIYVDVAYKDNLPVAGIGFFVINKNVKSSFYLCQDPDYQQFQGLSLLVLSALKDCKREGYSFFDLGTSSANMQARQNLFSFKENFSKVGVFRHTLELRMIR